MVSEYAYTPWGGRILLSGVNITDRGYTGHEHLSPFGDDTNSGFCLINMNGRIYDPVLARFLSPDPYVQSPDFTQSFNRYSYCSNNPFKYTDPSGNSIIAAILIGATINLVSQIIAGNVSNFGDAYLAFNIGALGGLAGAGAGAAISSVIGGSIGAIGGAAVGAAGGTAGGFVGGAGNAWFNGSNFGDGLVAGLKGAGIGALTGGVIGGVSGGIYSAEHGGDFWTGEGAKFEMIAPIDTKSDYVKIGDDMQYSNSYAKKFSDNNFDLQPIGVKKLIADGSMPAGYKSRGDYFTNANKIKGLAPGAKKVLGVTEYLGIKERMSNVYIAKAAFISKEQLYLTMGHEYIHAGLFKVGGIKGSDKAHASIYDWQYKQAKMWNWNAAHYQKLSNTYAPFRDAMYDYYLNKIGMQIISSKPY